ncbi:MAG TPA: anhydro-N-acetylmuramic acid kinase [Marinobacter sp.]|nr:anhydro-N-acetylmuramic acid kinase [Marinobacter sp.]
MTAWIGLMSGTSMDGIDAVLVSFENNAIEFHARHTLAYPAELRARLELAAQNHATPDELGELDTLTGQLFAEAANTVIRQSSISVVDIGAVGSHGQTIRHQPNGRAPFSLQIANPSIIAEHTGVATVADFRRRDMAAGGQGAPLMPLFHQSFFSSVEEDRCIINLGGIANITWLPKAGTGSVYGFDTGPANALLDAWCADQTGRHFDCNGRLAEEGTVNEVLLNDLFTDAYFASPAPKSTGKERFNLDWIKTRLQRYPDLLAPDVQRTLLQLTVISIARQMPHSTGVKVYACGGGALNPILMRELTRALSPAVVCSTEELGLDPQWVEPVGFAWLARRTVLGLSGNLPDVTGASGPRILGAIYPA